MKEVFWTNFAIEQIDSIYSYIEQSSNEYALQTVDRITQTTQRIGMFPQSGRKVPEMQDDNIREIFSGSYRIIYLIEADQIYILSVIHGARLLPP